LAKGGKPYVAHRLRKFGIELAMKVKGPDAGPYLLRQFDLVDQEKAANIKCPPRKPKPPPAPAPAPAPPPEPAPAPAPEAASTEGGKEGEGKEGEEGGEKKEEGGDEKKEGEKEGEKKKGIGEKVAAAGEKMAISLNLKDSPEKKEKAAAEAAAAEKAAAEVAAAEKAAADKAAAEKKAAEEARYPKELESDEAEAIRLCGLELYERGRAADKPGQVPSPSVKWGVMDAPRVAMSLHAAAVVLDCLKLFMPQLPADLLPFQRAAHRRSNDLAKHMQNYRVGEPILPLEWKPADMSAAVPVPCPPPPALPPSAFPSAPRR